MKFNNLITCIILVLTFLLTTSCKNLFRWTDAREVPVNAEERVQKNLEEGRGIQFGFGKNRGGGGTFDFASSNELWRASIEVLDFVSFTNASEENNQMFYSAEFEHFYKKCINYLPPSPEDIITILLNEFWKKFDKTLQDRANQLGFTVHEVVTLASIIEGEAMLSSERTTISSVYHNRLRINMKLQADPTIQYIIPGPPKTLSNRDLRIKSDYNTYQNYGLPPGPINNPGIESIKAALFPEKTDYIFFVAQGDGSHTFTTNEKDHEAAKRIYKINKRKNR